MISDATPTLRTREARLNRELFQSAMRKGRGNAGTMQKACRLREGSDSLLLRNEGLGDVSASVAPRSQKHRTDAQRKWNQEMRALQFSLFLPTPTLGPSYVKGMIKGQEVAMRLFLLCLALLLLPLIFSSPV